MTELERAQQQGNQAAPNLIEAAIKGELGGGGGIIMPEKADFINAWITLTSESADPDYEAVETIFNNFKSVSSGPDFFICSQRYSPANEEPLEDQNEEQNEEPGESTVYTFGIVSEKLLNHAKTVYSSELEMYRKILTPEEYARALEELQPIFDMLNETEADTILSLDSDTYGKSFVIMFLFLQLVSFDKPKTSATIIYLTEDDTEKIDPFFPGCYVLSFGNHFSGIDTSSISSMQYYGKTIFDEPIKLLEQPLIFSRYLQ